MMRSGKPADKGPAARIAGVLMSGIFGLTVFTFFVDMLLLVQPIYMLQVYNRVLTSASVETLVFISIMAAGALVLLGALDTIRSMMAGRLAAKMEVEAGADALIASINGPRAALGDVQPLRDLGAVRGFISNRGILAFLDLPFAPIFIIILYFIHPHLFWITVAGAVVLTLLALLNQWMASRATTGVGEQSMGAMLAAQAFTRNAESINAMGMVGNVIGAWGRDEAQSLRGQEAANKINAVFAGISRVIRLGLQMVILGYGGYLVLGGQMTAGMIFAASLISGRGLQPIDQVISGWKGFVETRKAWKRLQIALAQNATSIERTELPAPDGRLTIDQVVVMPPNSPTGEPLLKRVSATIDAGDCVAVIGPSGAGKSTLARTVIGAIKPNVGAIRIDGADIRTWDRELLGRHIGYLSQDVDLLPGTIAQNISRFTPDVADAEIVAAAQKAQVHDLILTLSNGYDTMIGPTGQQLSGGQRQRIGLARAFFGSPKLLVLDEPNANLDTAGDMALERAIMRAKEDKVTVFIVTQRRPIAEKADKILMLRDGAIEDFGPRNDVYERQNQKFKAAQDAQRAAAPTPVRLPQQIVAGRFGSVVKGGVPDAATGS